MSDREHSLQQRSPNIESTPADGTQACACVRAALLTAQSTAGVDFINILRAAFSRADLKSAK